ncbi:MAG TPA: M50 family metallopeptidase [Acidimicrobiales bacterium]|nr:M50 family metallopeptidase [Acidimicrobiales bacterium]
MSDVSGAPTPPESLSRTSGFGSLLRLLVVVAAGVALAVALNGLPVLIVVLALVAMIMLHELGHFATAKWSGMKVTEYFLGFGPKLWSIRRGETEYGVKAIPAGGYVRIVGMTMLEDVDPSDEARSYRQASFPRRVLVASAGSGMHVIIAFVLLFSLYAVSGAPTATSPTITSLAQFSKGLSPAQRAGLRPGDTIVSVDGHKYTDLNSFAAFVNKHPGDTLTFVVVRHGHDLTIRITPVDGRHVVEEFGGQRIQAANPSGPPKGIIGVELTGVRNVAVGPLTAIGRAGTGLVSLFGQTFTGLAQVFSLHGLGSFAHQIAVAGNTQSTGSSGASGSGSTQPAIISILGAVQIGAQAARQDVGALLYLLAAINLFVGIVNLIPMLPLDGGHVAIAVYERIRSRKGRPYHADVAKLMPVAYVFLFFIVIVGLGALYMNIVHPVQLPGG